MRIKTILHEDEIELKLTANELTWLTVLLHCLLNDDPIEGWKEDIKTGILFKHELYGDEQFPDWWLDKVL